MASAARPGIARAAGSLAFTLLLAGPLAAQIPRTLVIEGEGIFGHGNVDSVDSIRINDVGDWFVHVELDVGSNATRQLILRNGIPMLQGGDALADPEGARIGAFEQYSVNQHGEFLFALDLLDWDNGSDKGVCYNTDLIVQESMISSAPELTPGTPWISFFNVRLNDRNQVLCHGTVNDPNIPTGGDQVFALFEVTEAGEVLSESVIFKEGDALPDQSTVQLFGTQPRAVDFNNDGDFICFVDSTAGSSVDGSIQMTVGGVPTILAQEGHPSPIQDRNWTSLLNPGVALNDHGEYVFLGTMDGDSTTDKMLVKNGEKFAQEGDVLSALPPWQILSFHNAPVFLSNAGDVFWFCQINHADREQDTAILKNDEIIVREGITFIDGHYVDILWLFGESFSISPNGRYLVFRARLDDDRDGAFLIDFGAVLPMSECTGNEGTLDHVAGSPFLGETLEFRMGGGQAIGVLPVFMLSTDPVVGWPPCGLPIAAGELLIDFSAANGNPAYFDVGYPWGGTPLTYHVEIPDEPHLAGATIFAQGLFWDVGNQAPEPDFRLTGGLWFEILAL